MKYQSTVQNVRSLHDSYREYIITELKSGRKSDEIIERFLNTSGMPVKLLSEKVLEISPKTLSSYRYSPKRYRHLRKQGTIQ
jgi:hypothetical protein